MISVDTAIHGKTVKNAGISPPDIVTDLFACAIYPYFCYEK